MNYSFTVLPVCTEPFSKDVEEQFNRRDKSSSKCIDLILSSETSCESISQIPKLSSVSSKTLTPGSSHNTYSKRQTIKSSSVQNVIKSDIKLKFSTEENLELLLNNCMKDGLNFDEAFKILEQKSLVQVSLQTDTHKVDDNSEASSDSEN